MIRYEIECRSPNCRHRDERWFANSEAYARVESLKMLEPCTACGNASVGKALMTPAVSTRNVTKASGAEAIREHLREARRKIEAEGENVGANFAEEARKIHDGKTRNRLLYGTATADEYRELHEDGIEIQHMPWVPLHDA